VAVASHDPSWVAVAVGEIRASFPCLRREVASSVADSEKSGQSFVFLQLARRKVSLIALEPFLEALQPFRRSLIRRNLGLSLREEPRQCFLYGLERRESSFPARSSVSYDRLGI